MKVGECSRLSRHSGSTDQTLLLLGVRKAASIWYTEHSQGYLQSACIQTIQSKFCMGYEFSAESSLSIPRRKQQLCHCRLIYRGYQEAMRGVRNRMLMRTDQDGLLFVGELSHSNKVPKMDHLVCFLPGKAFLSSHSCSFHSFLYSL